MLMGKFLNIVDQIETLVELNKLLDVPKVIGMVTRSPGSGLCLYNKTLKWPNSKLLT